MIQTAQRQIAEKRLAIGLAESSLKEGVQSLGEVLVAAQIGEYLMGKNRIVEIAFERSVRQPENERRLQY